MEPQTERQIIQDLFQLIRQVFFFHSKLEEVVN